MQRGIEETVVIKIGGSILRDSNSYVQAAEEVKRVFVEQGKRPIIVVSAARGVTDLLLSAMRGSKEALERVEDLYYTVARSVGSLKLIKRVEQELGNLRSLIYSFVTFDASLSDLVLSYGERISKMLMVEALEVAGVKAFELDARELIVTDEVHGNATIDYAVTMRNLEKVHNSLCNTVAVPVIEGFVGCSYSGEVTTLGRGGSDYTATAIAALLSIEDVYLVTEVDGVMTADPKLVPSAKLVPLMSYEEALEASSHGVKRFNSKVFEPLEKFHGSNVYIGSWRCFGTKVVKALRPEMEGAKVVVYRALKEAPYVAVIGKGVSRATFVKYILESLISEGIEVLGIEAHLRRPSVMIYVDEKVALKALLSLHRRLFG